MRIQSTKSYGYDSIKMLIYGSPAIGKTSLAGTTGEPTCVISAEAGLLSLSGHDIDFIDMGHDDDGLMLPPSKRFDRLKDAFKYLMTEEAQKKYKWVFLDSLTEMGQLLHEKLLAKYPDRKDALILWGEMNTEMRSMIKAFRDIRGYNVVFTALAQPEKDENGRRSQGVMLQGKISDQLPAYFDEVFYYTMIDDEVKGQTRVLFTDSTDKFVAKDRSGKLDPIEKPDLKNIAEKIRKAQKQ